MSLRETIAKYEKQIAMLNWTVSQNNITTQPGETSDI